MRQIMTTLSRLKDRWCGGKFNEKENKERVETIEETIRTEATAEEKRGGEGKESRMEEGKIIKRITQRRDKEQYL